MSTRIKYPALYADVEPATFNGHTGSLVRCTATLRVLGFVWWRATGGTGVTWHFQSADDVMGVPITGERTTERQAVQALRDVSNHAGTTPRLPFGEERDDEARPTPRPTKPAPVAKPTRSAIPLPASSLVETPVTVKPVIDDGPVPTPKPVQQIVWDDDNTDGFDVGGAMRASLKKGKLL